LWNSGELKILLSGEGLNFQVPLRVIAEPTGMGLYCAFEVIIVVRRIDRNKIRLFILEDFSSANLS
jgi:hypothetical protein